MSNRLRYLRPQSGHPSTHNANPSTFNTSTKNSLKPSHYIPGPKPGPLREALNHTKPFYKPQTALLCTTEDTTTKHSILEDDRCFVFPGGSKTWLLRGQVASDLQGQALPGLSRGLRCETQQLEPSLPIRVRRVPLKVGFLSNILLNCCITAPKGLVLVPLCQFMGMLQ